VNFTQVNETGIMDSEMNFDDDARIKYQRLYDSHQKLLKMNQSLEEKLLKIVDRCEVDKKILREQINSLNLQMFEKNKQLDEIHQVNQRLLAENDRNKSDISIAIQLLHCQRPSSLSSCKLSNLPTDLQSKARNHIQQDAPKEKAQCEKKGKVIRVPISAFPSTTVIYSVNSGDDNDNEEVANDVVSASIMAKVLEERQKEVENESLSSPITRSPCCLPRSASVLDGLRYIDHGTQTYPAFIGERDKTRNTCVFCQGCRDTHQNLMQATSAISRSDAVIQETESSDGPVSSVIRTSNHHSTMKEIQDHFLNDPVLPCI